MRLLEPSGATLFRLAAVGDVGVVGTARARLAREPSMALAALADGLGGAEMGFANIEFPVARPEWLRQGASREQWHDAGAVGALAAAGVTHASLANNHVMDAGPRGLAATLDACAEHGIATVGAGRGLEAARRPIVREIRGHKVVLLARAALAERPAAEQWCVAPLEAAALRADLREWRGRADTLLVSVHWGSMYVDYPPPRVIDAARIMAEEGVDVVLGHHPHVLQGVRRMGRTLVLHSLGDAVFDPRSGEFEARVASETRRMSAVFRVDLAGHHGVDVFPLWLDDDGVPTAAAPAVAERVIERLRALSLGLEQGAERFAAESAPTLLRYELQSMGEYLRRGRFDRVVRLLASVRPRHLPVLWHALWRRGRAA